MAYTVTVKFRKNRDYSNENKDLIIFLLPPRYRISRENLSDLDNGGEHTFVFENLEVAKNFSTQLFLRYNSIFDVRTDFGDLI
jgi:hypothetical protein